MNDAAFDLPEASFVDRTITYLEGKSPSGTDVVLMIERAPFPDGQTLRQAVAEAVRDARARLPRYEVLFEREADVAEGAALEVGARWRDEGGVVYTRQTHLVLGATLVSIIGEAPLEEREFCDAYIAHVVSSLRART